MATTPPIPPALTVAPRFVPGKKPPSPAQAPLQVMPAVPMAPNTDVPSFTSLRKTGISVSPFRRMGHSFLQYFQSIDRSTFGLEGETHVERLKGVGQKLASNLPGTAGNFFGYAGGLAGVLTIAGAAVASGAFLAAMAGPQVAVTAAVIGIFLLILSTYTNREGAHEVLAKYTWNMIDTMPPEKGVIFDAAGLAEAFSAAVTLMEDGKNQIKLMGSKMKTRQEELTAFHAVISQRQARYADLLTAGDLAAAAAHQDATVQMITEAKKPRGTVAEYVRRCVHTANYIQAPHIIALAMKEKLSPNTTIGVTQTDYFKDVALAQHCRLYFQNLERVYADISYIPPTPAAAPTPPAPAPGPPAPGPATTGVRPVAPSPAPAPPPRAPLTRTPGVGGLGGHRGP